MQINKRTTNGTKDIWKGLKWQRSPMLYCTQKCFKVPECFLTPIKHNVILRCVNGKNKNLKLKLKIVKNSSERSVFFTAITLYFIVI